MPPLLPVPLRPMTLSDLLDGAFAVIKVQPRTVFSISAVILIPTHLLAAYLQRDAASQFSVTNTFTLLNAGGQTRVGSTDLLWPYFGAVLLSLSLFFMGGALGRLVTAWYAGGRLTAGEALGAAFRRTPAILVAFVVLLVAKMVGTCGFYVGMPVLVALFSLTAPVLVVENLGPFAAARRSWQLIGRRFWPCLGIVVLAAMGSSLLTAVIGGVPSVLAGLLPAPFNWLANAALAAGVSMIVTTALVSVSVLMYIDLRIRTEGLDIELGATEAFARGR
jgi:hypothetical protein